MRIKKLAKTFLKLPEQRFRLGNPETLFFKKWQKKGCLYTQFFISAPSNKIIVCSVSWSDCVVTSPHRFVLRIRLLPITSKSTVKFKVSKNRTRQHKKEKEKRWRGQRRLWKGREKIRKIATGKRGGNEEENVRPGKRREENDLEGFPGRPRQIWFCVASHVDFHGNFAAKTISNILQANVSFDYTRWQEFPVCAKRCQSIYNKHLPVPTGIYQRWNVKSKASWRRLREFNKGLSFILVKIFEWLWNTAGSKLE